MHTFHIDGLDHRLRVVRFEGHEGMSQLFEFDVLVACDAGDVAFANVVGKAAVLTFRAADEPRRVHGIGASFEQGEERRKATAYRATLVPAVWRLCHRRDSRIFQELAVPDILEKVLKTAGVPGERDRIQACNDSPALDRWLESVPEAKTAADVLGRAPPVSIMEQQPEAKARFPPFAQQLIERGRLDGIREGELRGKQDGIREGELRGKRDALLRLLARAAIALTDGERDRIQACTEGATLDRWVDNVLGAKTAADVLG